MPWGLKTTILPCPGKTNHKAKLLPTMLVGWYVGMTLKNGCINPCITCMCKMGSNFAVDVKNM